MDRKLLGLPGWGYLTVGLVVVGVTRKGGTVAIVCKKCGGLFKRRAKNDNDQSVKNKNYHYDVQIIYNRSCSCL